MGHSSIRIKVRRRKVAQLAAYSRQHTVRNNTIPEKVSDKIIYQVPWNTITNKLTKFNVGPNMAGTYMVVDDKPDKYGLRYHRLTCSWKKEKYPQTKPMMKKHTELIYNKETHMTEKVKVASTFPTKKYVDIQKSLWKNLGKAAKMEAYVQDKLKKWEKKHPKPCPDDDLFKDEMIPAWEAEKEQALIRTRDFVVSMFDKLPLAGRFKISTRGTAQYQEKMVAELKDINGDGHHVNDLDKNSKLLKKAQEITDKTHAKHANLVCTNLKDHKRKKGRMILPKAA